MAIETIPIRPELRARLEDYAKRHGQDPALALDDVLAAALDWESQDYQEAVEGVRRGIDDVNAGRTRSAAEFLAEVRRKYGFAG